MSVKTFLKAQLDKVRLMHVPEVEDCSVENYV